MNRKNDCELKRKETYLPPIMLVNLIELEESIVSSSAIIEGPSSGNQPDVTDWENKDDNYDWEF